MFHLIYTETKSWIRYTVQQKSNYLKRVIHLHASVARCSILDTAILAGEPYNYETNQTAERNKSQIMNENQPVSH